MHKRGTISRTVQIHIYNLEAAKNTEILKNYIYNVNTYTFRPNWFANLSVAYQAVHCKNHNLETVKTYIYEHPVFPKVRCKTTKIPLFSIVYKNASASGARKC